MKCHVLGHVQPCKASLCAEIEREHQAVRAPLEAEIRRLKALMTGLLVVLVNGELTLEGQHMIAAGLKEALAKSAQAPRKDSEGT